MSTVTVATVLEEDTTTTATATEVAMGKASVNDTLSGRLLTCGVVLVLRFDSLLDMIFGSILSAASFFRRTWKLVLRAKNNYRYSLKYKPRRSLYFQRVAAKRHTKIYVFVQVKISQYSQNTAMRNGTYTVDVLTVPNNISRARIPVQIWGSLYFQAALRGAYKGGIRYMLRFRSIGYPPYYRKLAR